MAHFSKLGINGKVIQVVPLEDKYLLDGDGNENEKIGQQYLERNHNWPAEMWIKTSYNTYENQHTEGGTPFRGNYGAIGSIWDEDNQIFWPRKPYPSWVKDVATASWKSPIGDAPNLTSEQISQNEAETHSWDYKWNEEGESWDLTNSLL